MKNNSLISKFEEIVTGLIKIKEQHTAGFMVDYEDLVKATSDGYMLNWVNIGPTKKLKKETQILIAERVNKYKKNIQTNKILYDNTYYEDIIRSILEQKGVIEEIICTKPYSIASKYLKKTIEDITDEEISNYIRQNELTEHKVLSKRLQ
ncbi:MAG: hypothetical protein VZS44_01450 [Bacilli bacterium]|nr:hypothetical protein [Bacilli bacterium]